MVSVTKILCIFALANLTAYNHAANLKFANKFWLRTKPIYRWSAFLLNENKIDSLKPYYYEKHQ